ncbi:MAG: DUF4347 domain-containing protein [Rhodoferax sp.]|nr:DUF4347 domain-containing protein [Rhodoferax sp.]
MSAIPASNIVAPLVLRDADPQQNNGRREVAFIENNVADWETLAAGVRAGVEVVVLDSRGDGLAQMADYLGQKEPGSVNAIHLLSHGSSGAINLGTLTLSSNLNDHTDTLTRIGSALTADGDFLVYGCEVAEGQTGVEFVGKLAQATGADVAASADLTGAALSGGDWVLEAKSGQIDVESLSIIGYHDLLGLQNVKANLFFNAVSYDAGTVAVNSGVEFHFDASGSGAGNDWNIDAANNTITITFDDNTGFSLGQDLGVITLSNDTNGNFVSFSSIVKTSATGSGSDAVTATVDTNNPTKINITDNAGGQTWNGGTIVFTFTPVLTGGDTTAPTFDVAPATSDVQQTTVDLSASIDEGGTVYYVVVADGATAPTSAQVVAGTTYSSVTIVANGSQAVGSSPFTASFDNISGLTAGTAYDIYVVGQDDEGTPNLMTSPTKVDVTTAAPPAPTVTGVTSSTANGSYNAGDVISIQVTFSESVTVSGTPQLTLETGATDRTINYASGSPGTTLTFSYTVQAGDTSADLDYTSTTALALNSGSIVATTGGATAILTLASPGAANSLGDNKAIVIDTTAPNAPSTPNMLAGTDSGSSNSDDITNDTTPNINGTTETNASITLYDTDGITVVGTGSGNPTNWLITTLTLSEGTHTITAKATDAAGNVSVASSGLTITIDTSAPAAPSTPDMTAGTDSGTSNSDKLTNDTTPTFTGTAEANATVTLISSVNGTVGTATADGSGNWSITASTLNSGAHTFTATATDTAGNVGSASSGLSVTIDATAPTLTNSTLSFSADTGASSTDFITKTAAQTISGTLSGVTTTGDIVEVSLDNGSTWTSATNTVGQNTWSLAGQTLTASNTLQVRVTDAAGNSGTAATQAYVLDTTAPALTGTVGIASSNATNTLAKVGDTVTVSFTTDGSQNGSPSATINGNAATIASGGGNAYTATYTMVVGDTEGAVSFAINATDLAGNAMTPVTAVTNASAVTFDKTAPATATATLSIAENSANTTAVGTVASAGASSFSLTDTAGGRFAIGSGTGAVTVLDGTQLNFEANTSHNITVRATDAAGNFTDTVLSVSVTDVNEAPVNTKPAAQTFIEDATLVFSAGNSNALSVADVDAGTTLTTVVSVDSGKGTLAVTTGGGGAITGDGSNSVQIIGTVAQVQNALASVTYTPTANGFGTAYATLTLASTDNGTGTLSDTDTVTLNITGVADTPTVTNISTTPATQTSSGLVLSRNAADSTEVTHFKITGISNGNLFQNDGTTAIANDDFISFAEGNAGLKFTPTGGGDGSFTAQASTSNADGGLGGATVNATIAVGAAVASPSVNEDTDSGAIAISQGGAETHYKFTSITGGTLFSDAGYTTQITDGSFIASAGATTDSSKLTLSFSPTFGPL